MAGRLTTHVLDAVQGRPAAGLAIEVYRIHQSDDGESRERICMVRTNPNGRTDDPLLAGDALTYGIYEIVFDVGSYFAASGHANAAIPFLSKIPVRFGVADSEANYHVPLITTPWAYSTYRGS
jgi:5-hydroxyisourate hydrolase